MYTPAQAYTEAYDIAHRAHATVSKPSSFADIVADKKARAYAITALQAAANAYTELARATLNLHAARAVIAAHEAATTTPGDDAIMT